MKYIIIFLLFLSCNFLFSDESTDVDNTLKNNENLFFLKNDWSIGNISDDSITIYNIFDKEDYEKSNSPDLWRMSPRPFSSTFFSSNLMKRYFNEEPSIAPFHIVFRVESTLKKYTIGRKVYDKYFKDNSDFKILIGFGCGNIQKRYYSDPRNIWYNVFFGYYIVKVNKKKWGRPFGFNNNKIFENDIINIGKADWNYFSNYCYGVPENKIEKINDNTNDIKFTIYKTEDVNNGDYYIVQIDNIMVVSSYANWLTKPYYKKNKFSGIWRFFYGYPCKATFPNHKNFEPVSMSAKFLIKVEEDNDNYYTIFVGGSVCKDFGSDEIRNTFLNNTLKSLENITEEVKKKKFIYRTDIQKY